MKTIKLIDIEDFWEEEYQIESFTQIPNVGDQVYTKRGHRLVKSRRFDYEDKIVTLLLT